METQLNTANKLVKYAMSLSTSMNENRLKFKLSSDSDEHKRRFVFLFGSIKIVFKVKKKVLL